jgi:O-antigen/teichoic acid export membrane protein
MSLRTQVLRGGTYLVLRQGIGMVIGLGGVLLLTRTIGPEKYGLYTAAFGIFWYLQTICQLGIEVYLVRKEGEEDAKSYHQAFTLLLLLGLGGTVLAFLSLPLLEAWVRLEGFRSVIATMFCALPVVLVTQVPLAKLERNLDYKQVALIELCNQLVFYLVALSLAFRGYGVWAPVIGWWVQQSQALGLFYWGARYRPRFCWDKALVKSMLGYSIGFSASMWVWHLRILVSPLLVGRYAGAEAVGYVSLAVRIVEILSFAKSISWRLAIATLAKVQDDKPRLVKAITEGMNLQLLALGPLVVGFGWVAPWLLPLVFGPRWAPVAQVYPFIALGYLTNAIFNLHSSVLYVLKRNWEVTAFHAVHITLFAGAAFLLIPKLGLVGYGWAEVAALASYSVIHFYVSRCVEAPDYRLIGLWWSAFGAALFVFQVGWWAAIGLVIIAFWPGTYQQIQDYIKTFTGKVKQS